MGGVYGDELMKRQKVITRNTVTDHFRTRRTLVALEETMVDEGSGEGKIRLKRAICRLEGVGRSCYTEKKA